MDSGAGVQPLQVEAGRIWVSPEGHGNVTSQRDQPSLHSGTDFWLETADAAHGTRLWLDAGGRQRAELRQTIVFVGVSSGPGSHLHP